MFFDSMRWARRLSFARVATLVAVCALLFSVGPRPSAQSASDAEWVPNEILVKFRPSAGSSRRTTVLNAVSGARVRRFSRFDIDHIRLPKNLSVERALQIMRAMPDVLMVQPNYIQRIVASAPPNDPYWLADSLWGLPKISAPAAWTNFGTGSSDVVIADIDTGINYLHPDLIANVWSAPSQMTVSIGDGQTVTCAQGTHGFNAITNTCFPLDDHGHGTLTSGVAGAVGNNGIGVVGVSWNSKIISCKFLNAFGSGSDADAISCFNYLVDLKINHGVNIRVTNNSWGGSRGDGVDTMLQGAIDAAGSAGIINVFAAGNVGTNNDIAPFDPASMDSPSIVSVAASDQNDNRANFGGPMSNYGPTTVDLAAPGLSIVSTYGLGYGTASGTSLATPFVAGAAALVAARNPNITVAGLKAALVNNVDKLGQWTGVVASGGRLNVLASAIAASSDAHPTVSITAPLTGASLTVPPAISVTASADDSDGTVSSVVFYVGAVPIGTDTTSPYSVTWTPGAGVYTLTAVATDNLGASTTSLPIQVTVTTPILPSPTGLNVAAATAGATAVASSLYGSGYAAAAAIDGNRTGAPWGNGGGWTDGTANTFPDWLEVDFQGTKTIDRIDVFSVQDNYQSPSAPTASMAFSLYGLTHFQLQYWDGGQWLAVPNGSISGNTSIWRTVTFTPLTTTRIRLWVTGALNAWSRLAEIEAYEYVAPPVTPVAGVNVAAAAAGATAVASSLYGSGYAAAAAIDGNRTGAPWGSGGGWTDGTANTFPDWLEVDFQGAKTINEIDVFSVQDNYQAPIAPTSSMTFSLYGLTAFQLQYWDGAQWLAVPNGNISGNALIWRTVTFAPLTTTRIRLWVTGALNAWSRLAEIEARQVIVPPTDAPPTVSLTGLADGTSLNAVTVALTATANDSDGSVSGVGFYVNGSLLGTSPASPYGISWTPVAGSYTLTAVATDNLGATTTSVPIQVTVTTATPPSPTGTNVAAAAAGATALASSVYGGGYSAAAAIDGNRTGAPWGDGGGWADGTANSFPDWLEVDFQGAKTISQIDVFSVQDNYQAPSVPTSSMTFGLYGLTTFQLQYWDGAQWLPVPNGSISGNTLVWRTVTFAPLTTTRIRLWITGALNAWSRLPEIEAYDGVPPVTPVTAVNVAASAAGAAAVASSLYGSGYAPASAIDGNRTGAPWGNGGGWADGTVSSFPDWLEVDFQGAKTITEIDVFSVQDNYQAPSVPTPSMTFSLYGLTDFQLQYWDGAQWLPVPNGSVSGNTLVWRTITFAPLTTTRIRLWITGALNAWSRLPEIEAYTQ